MCLCGPNNVVLCFGDHGTKEMLGVIGSKFDRFQTLCNNSQQHATGWMQHVTSNNVGSCWPTMLCPFAQGFRPWRLD